MHVYIVYLQHKTICHTHNEKNRDVQGFTAILSENVQLSTETGENSLEKVLHLHHLQRFLKMNPQILIITLT